MDPKDILFSDVLGVNPNKVAEKCAEFSTMALFKTLTERESVTPELLIDFIKIEFTEEERLFLVLGRLLEDTVSGLEKIKQSSLIEVIMKAQKEQKEK